MRLVNRQADIETFLRLLEKSTTCTAPHGVSYRTSISELEELDRFLKDMGNELLMPPGSIARVVWHSLLNWTVGITPDNIEWLMEHAEASILEEWLTSGPANNTIIANATKRVGLNDGNQRLNEAIALMVVDILQAMHEDDPDRHFTIADIGAGTGFTTGAILTRMMLLPHLAKCCNFYLIELSADRVSTISKSLKEHPINDMAEIGMQVVTSGDSVHLPFIRPGSFDFVVSSAVFHHNTFPNYLLRIKDTLAKDGILAFGDWHMSICEHPARVVPLLRKLEASEHAVGEFMDKFGVKEWQIERLNEQLPLEEQAANSIFRGYIHEIGLELKRLRQESKVQMTTSLKARMGKRTGELIREGALGSAQARIVAAAELVACRPEGMSVEERFEQLGISRRMAVHVDAYAKRYAKELAQLEKDGKPVPDMFFLEALEQLDKKKESLELIGFETDWEELKKKRPFRKRGSNIISIYKKRAKNMTTAIAVGKMDKRKRNAKRPRTSWSAPPTMG